jgi:WD40 repeat protein
MHAERDYLVKDVFPDLREWCEDRKIHLVDIDLRWGVTEEDSSSNHTVLACLNNIDESRPFFLCFLGQRRGWVPEKGNVSPETLDEYPDLSNAVGRNSVTEMEIEHALLSPMRHIVNGNEKQEIPVRHALFYFRNPNYLNDLTIDQRKIFTNEAEKDVTSADYELIKFKEKIKSGWKYTIDYDCRWDKSVISPELPENVRQGRLTDLSASGKDLKDIIIEQLKEEIIKEFPDREKVEYSSDLERDLDQQALFIELNGEGFISREGDFDALNDYVSNDKNGLFVLTAPAGSGKSMLLANFITRESKKHNVRFLNRFCGVSDLCSQQYSLWKTIFDEARIECPGALKDLKDKIEDLLKELAKEKTVLIIDAINQLPNGLNMPEWLPDRLPENLKIILSLKEDEKNEELTNGIEKLKENENVSNSTIKPFNGKEEKKKLIHDYLKKYLKALDDKQIDAICDFEGSKNPLYLKVLLSELRVFGSFVRLSDEIRQFGETPQEAFNAVLNRLENDINSLNINSKELVALLFGLLANARNGLSEKEIVSCMQKELGIDEGKLIRAIRLFVRQVRPFMARREGRTDYFYEAFKLAAEEKYKKNKLHYNAILSDYFKKQTDPDDDLTFNGLCARDFNELPYHYYHSQNIAALEDILGEYFWIQNKLNLIDIDTTAKDYEDYIDDKQHYLKLIGECLTLSAQVLKEAKEQLPSQLWGRMADIENVSIRTFLMSICEKVKYAWLRPASACFTMPGGALQFQIESTRHVIYNLFTCFDGSILLTIGDDVTVVYNTKLKKEIISVEDFVLTGCVSPDGKWVALVLNNNSVQIWNTTSCRKIKSMTLPEMDDFSDMRKNGWPSSTTISSSTDGNIFVIGREDGLLWMWERNIDKNTILNPPQGIEFKMAYRTHHVVVSKKDNYIFALTNENITIWDSKTKIPLLKTPVHEHFTCLAIDEAEHLAYLVKWMSTDVYQWNYMHNGPIEKIYEDDDIYNRIDKNFCMSDDGQISAILNGNNIDIFNAGYKEKVRVLENDLGYVKAIALSGNGDMLFTYEDYNYEHNTSVTGSILCWNPRKDFKFGSARNDISDEYSEITNWCFNRNWDACAYCKNDGTVSVMHFNGILTDVSHLKICDSEITCIAMNDEWLIAGNEQGDITIVSRDTINSKIVDDPSAEVNIHSGKINAASIYLDTLAVALDDGFLCIFNLSPARSGKAIEYRKYKLFNSCVNDAVIIKYGSQIVCTGDKDIVKIYDYDFEKLKFRFEKKFSDQKSYHILETSYDGQYISFRKANCRYGEVAILDTENLTLIENLAGFGDFIYGRNPVPPIGRTMTENGRFVCGLCAVYISNRNIDGLNMEYVNGLWICWDDISLNNMKENNMKYSYGAAIWDTRTKERVWQLYDPALGKAYGRIRHCVISEDGQYLLTVADRDGFITLWNIQNKEVITRLKWQGGIEMIDINTFAGLIAVGGENGSLLFAKLEL